MRLADQNDIVELVDLRMEFLDVTDPLIREQNIKYFEEHLNRDLFAGIVEGESCVLMQVMQAPPNTWANYSRYGLIVGVYTRPEFRRKGNLDGLMKIILKKAKDENLEYVELQASKDGKNTYTRFGFEPGGYSKYEYMKKVLK